MKIDNNDTLTIRSGATDPLTAPTPTAPGSTKPPAGAPRADQITLSPEALLLQQAAADAASADPAVRADVVERMKKLLDKGEIGADAQRLADALIDDVLKNT